MKPPKERKDRVTPARQTPEKRKVLSAFEERNQTIKKALKEFRKPLSEAIDYTVRIEGGTANTVLVLIRSMILCTGIMGCRSCMNRLIAKIGIWF